ncbi:hypothetical protein [Tsukamurella soli]|uniref:Uncharacterized protein n=1 Tax=Tsukamurella soli TaxID=644556 RepID=A0ABP8KDK2_9ACTN
MPGRREWSADDVARVFGEELPEQVRDAAQASDDARADGGGERDRWIADNRPPHH